MDRISGFGPDDRGSNPRTLVYLLKMEKKRKTCPVCNSTRITYSDIGMSCKRCGYTNKTTKKINKDLSK